MLAGLRDAGVVSRTPDGRWHRTRRIAHVEVPSSVSGLTRARLAELADDDRELLDAACCAGYRFDPELVADALGMRRLAVLQRLARIERRHRLVRSDGDAFRFDHPQVHEELRAALPDALRRASHGALADAFERRLAGKGIAPADARGEAAAFLCEHRFEEGRPDRMLPVLDAAAAHLEAGDRLDRALPLVEAVLDAEGLVDGVQRVELLLRRVTWLEIVARTAEAPDSLEDAAGLADARGDERLRARVRIAQGRHWMRLARADDAVRVLQEAIELARAGGARAEEGTATGTLANVRMRHGDAEGARAGFLGHLALAREIGDRMGEARALGGLGNLAHGLGDLEQALQHDREALALWRELGQRRFESIALGNLGTILLGLGRFDEAREHFEQHRALAKRTGDREGEARAIGNLAALAQDLGRLAAALESTRRHGELCREIGYPRGALVASINTGITRLALGQPKEAVTVFAEALERGRALRIPDVEGEALLGLAQAAAEAGDADEAERRLREALDVWGNAGVTHGEARALVALAALLLERDEHDVAAREHLRRASALAREAGDVASVVRAAAKACLCGETVPADAEAELARAESHLPLVVRMEVHHDLFRATGDVAHLERAEALLDELAAHAPASTRTDVLDGVALHRRIRAGWIGRGGEADSGPAVDETLPG